MDAQQFLQDKIGGLIKNAAIMAVPVPAPVKVASVIGGSSKQTDQEFNPGPLIKIGNPFNGESLIQMRDSRVYHDPELGIYGPGASAYDSDAGSYEARVQ